MSSLSLDFLHEKRSKTKQAELLGGDMKTLTAPLREPKFLLGNYQKCSPTPITTLPTFGGPAAFAQAAAGPKAPFAPSNFECAQNPDIKYSHGTTTLGFVFKEGVLIAVDSRATMGSYIGVSFFLFGALELTFHHQDQTV
eukprot:TRINITY_DN1677_c0_g1_i3.p1 TRINITY_DN1677_c0_g1~~TRINITY_DN1677_c0_g1_i3.p1  ORF type:complete len:140 (+),score=38.95 TRINITY_DN1677_c0_g1_i3:97-516(+)